MAHPAVCFHAQREQQGEQNFPRFSFYHQCDLWWSLYCLMSRSLPEFCVKMPPSRCCVEVTELQALEHVEAHKLHTCRVMCTIHSCVVFDRWSMACCFRKSYVYLLSVDLDCISNVVILHTVCHCFSSVLESYISVKSYLLSLLFSSFFFCAAYTFTLTVKWIWLYV